MNLYFDLLVIGLIGIAVLLNLYHSREQSLETGSLISRLGEKLFPSFQFGKKTTVRHHAPAYFSLD